MYIFTNWAHMLVIYIFGQFTIKDLETFLWITETKYIVKIHQKYFLGLLRLLESKQNIQKVNLEKANLLLNSWAIRKSVIEEEPTTCNDLPNTLKEK